jgi:hypothetical protein
MQYNVSTNILGDVKVSNHAEHLYDNEPKGSK